MPPKNWTVEDKRAFQRKWVADRRAAWFAGKACMVCNETDRLELHHLNPAEKVTSHIWSWSTERREAELAKCVPLCHDCHLAETREWARMKALERRDHGTHQRYDLGCRCKPCGTAKVAYNRAHPTRRLAEAA